MKKSEMEAHRIEYYHCMESAENAERQGFYRLAVDSAMSAWEYIDGMIQFETKFEHREFTGISAIEFVLKYAPLLLDSASLDKLEQLLVTRRRIERATSEDQAANLDRSRKEILENYKLWSYLESNGPSDQDAMEIYLGGDRTYWRSVVKSWTKMGLIGRTGSDGAHRLALVTRLGQVIRARCPVCGVISEAPKAMLLTKTACLQCRQNIFFVFLPNSIQES